MTRYAEGTTVSADQSISELKRSINRFGATGFAYAEQGNRVQVHFQSNGLVIRFDMTLPAREDFRLTETGRIRSQSAALDEWEKACRRQWRSLAAVVKAKLIAVDDGISTFEQEFLAFVVLPNGETVGDRMVPDIRAIATTGNVPSVLALPERGR